MPRARRQRQPGPVLDGHVAIAMASAMNELSKRRDVDWRTDALARVRCAAELELELDVELRVAVTRARSEGASWADVGDCIGIAAGSASARFGREQTSGQEQDSSTG